jgi:putative addiction module component, TIGR02574 family
MSTAPSIESVQEAALQLQPAARAQLTHALVQSLAALPEAELAELWLAEAERRDAEMESGQVVGIPGEEVFRRLRARYLK